MTSLRAAFGRLALLGALSLPALSLLVPSDANASVSIAVGFDQLVKDADAVAFITPVESMAVWEDGRIYTYTKVKVDQGVAGDVGAGADGWVRTMGGVVGKIGQMVDGEPVLVQGKPSLLFLRKFKSGGVFEVSARAQGQYPVVVDEKTKARRLIRSANAGMLLPPKQQLPISQVGAAQTQAPTQSVSTPVASVRLAQEVLHDRAVDEISREIATSWRRLHPTPATAK